MAQLSNAVANPAMLAATNAAAASAPPLSLEEQAHTYFEGTVKPILATNDAAKAQASLLQCLAIDPIYVPALYRLGSLNEDAESWDAALDYYKKVKAANTDPACGTLIDRKIVEVQKFQKIDGLPGGRQERQYDGHVLAAQLLLTAQKYDAALKESRAAISVNANRPEAFLAAGAADSGLHDYDEEIEMLGKGVDFLPPEKKPVVENLMAAAREQRDKMNRFQQFAAFLSQALANSQNPSLAAINAYDAFKLFPGRTDVALRAASSFILAQQYPQALQVLDDATKTARGEQAGQVKALRSKVTRLIVLLQKQIVSDLSFGLCYENVPWDALKTLRQLVRQRAGIRSINIVGVGKWVILCDKNSSYWMGIDNSLANVLTNCFKQGSVINSVSLGADGSWSVIYDDFDFQTSGLPDNAISNLQNLNKAHNAINLLAEGQGPFGNAFELVYGGNGNWGLGTSFHLSDTFKMITSLGRTVFHVSFYQDLCAVTTESGEYGFYPPNLITRIDKMKSQGRTTRLIDFTDQGGWVAIFNRS